MLPLLREVVLRDQLEVAMSAMEVVTVVLDQQEQVVQADIPARVVRG
jgi:hypothetical protein